MDQATLMRALRNADAAGDEQAARRFAQMIRLSSQSEQPEEAYSPNEGMNAVQRATVGLGKGLHDAWAGVKQLALNAYDGDAAEAYRQQLAEDQALWDRNAEGVAMKGGELVGQMLPGIPFGMGLGAVASKVPALAALASKAPAALTTAGQFAASGAGGAALMPILEGGDFLKNKASQLTEGAALGVLTGGALKAGGKAVEALMPDNILARTVNKIASDKAGSEYLKEGQRLSAATGVDLPLDMMADSKALTMARNATRQSFFTADDAFKTDVKLADQALARINKIMDNISPRASGVDSIGDRVRTTVKSAVDDIVKARDIQAGKDYGAIRKIAGGKAGIMMNNAMKEADDIIQEFHGVASPEAQKIVQSMTALKGSLAGERVASSMIEASALSRGVEINKALRNRSFFSNASKGTGNIFDDVSPTVQRKIAARMATAMGQDFDDAATAVGGDIGKMLRDANENYAKHMKSIDYIEASPVGRIMGEEFADALYGGGTLNKVSGYEVAERLRRMNPDEIKIVRGIVERQSPDVAQDMKRFWLEDALEKSMSQAPSAGANVLPMDGNKFIRALTGNPKEKAKALAMFDKGEWKQISDVIDVMRRFGDKFGYNHSNTAPASELLGIFGGAANRLTSTVGQTLALRKFSQAMADPRGRQAVMTIYTTPMSSQQYANAAAYLTGVWASAPALNKVSNDSKGQNYSQ